MRTTYHLLMTPTSVDTTLVMTSRHDLLMVDVTDIASTQVLGQQGQSMKHRANLGWCRAGADHLPSFDTTDLRWHHLGDDHSP